MSTAFSKLRLILLFALLPVLHGQDPVKPATKPAATEQEYTTKSFELKYTDPDQIRQMFADRSFVMEVNRSLKVLTVHGPASFLKEVEDAVKRFDVAPPPPVNFQITIYLLTVAAQAPAGVALPTELAAVSKELTAAGSQPLKLADSHMLRLREVQTVEATSAPGATPSALMSRVKLQSAALTPGPKGDLVSLNGLKIWIDMPPPATGDKTPPKTDPDVAVDLDVEQNQAIIASKSGLDKPVVVVVRAAVIK
jgi:hypothetical protein